MKYRFGLFLGALTLALAAVAFIASFALPESQISADIVAGNCPKGEKYDVRTNLEYVRTEKETSEPGRDILVMKDLNAPQNSGYNPEIWYEVSFSNDGYYGGAIYPAPASAVTSKKYGGPGTVWTFVSNKVSSDPSLPGANLRPIVFCSERYTGSTSFNSNATPPPPPPALKNLIAIPAPTPSAQNTSSNSDRSAITVLPSPTSSTQSSLTSQIGTDTFPPLTQPQVVTSPTRQGIFSRFFTSIGNFFRNIF